MEEKNIGELQKSTSRRSRKDEQGRDFLCGCGKRYLSYPALYTHIKTKHEGRQPEGTLKTGTSQIARRTKTKPDQQILKNQLKIFELLGQSIHGSVPFNSRLKKDLVPKQLYQIYLGLIKQQQVKLTSGSSLDLAIIIYLLNIGEHINQKVYEQFLFLAKVARNSFLEHGNELCIARYSKKEANSIIFPDFTVTEVKYFPIMAEFIIDNYIPITFEKELKDINISLMKLLLLDFCNWLLIHKLTNIRLTFAQQFKLDYKPPVGKAKGLKNDHLRDVQDLIQIRNSKDIKDEQDEEYEEGSEIQQIEQEGQQGSRKMSHNSKQRL